MEIIKNNGKIVIEEYNESNGFIAAKTIRAYNITVLDLEGVEKLKGRLKVQQLKNRKNYKFSHNSNNNALIEYVLNELKKHKYIDIK